MMPASLLILVVQGEKTEAPGHQNFPELTYPVAELGADLTQCDSTPVAHEVVPLSQPENCWYIVLVF